MTAKNDELAALVMEMVNFEPECDSDGYCGPQLTSESQEWLKSWRVRAEDVLVARKREAWPVGTWVKAPDGIRGTIEELNWHSLTGLEVLVRAEGRKGLWRFKLEEAERL